MQWEVWNRKYPSPRSFFGRPLLLILFHLKKQIVNIFWSHLYHINLLIWPNQFRLFQKWHFSKTFLKWGCLMFLLVCLVRPSASNSSILDFYADFLTWKMTMTRKQLSIRILRKFFFWKISKKYPEIQPRWS